MSKTLPLGIDIGAARVRVICTEIHPAGPRVVAAAVRALPAAEILSDCDHLGILIEEAVKELGTRERRCVCALGEPEGILRSLTSPPMSAGETRRWAALEAGRYTAYPPAETVMQIHPAGAVAGRWALGMARKSTLQARVRALRVARLRPVAVDHEAYALCRALPEYDAVLDIGMQRSCLHLTKGEVPQTFVCFNGGADITKAIEIELGIDRTTAERRKRILGTAGAGERARSALVADLSELVRATREMLPVTRIALVGNGSRLFGLAEDLAKAAGITAEVPVSETLRGSYADDVLRAAAADWTLAAGLTLWGHSS